MNKLGRRKPLTRPRLQLADMHVDGPQGVFEPPAEVHRTDQDVPMSMYANGPDATVTLNAAVAEFGAGCCVEAMIHNAIRHMRFGSGWSLPPFTGDMTLELYRAIEGYDWTQTRADGSNPTDKGTEPNKAFTFWRDVGVPLPHGGVDRIAGFLNVNAQDPREWKTAVAVLDIAATGYELPVTIRGETGEWVVVDPSLQGDAAPGSLGGHEVLTVSYDPTRQRVKEWAENRLVNHEFNLAYCDQMTAVVGLDQLNKSGVSETGLDHDKLSQALQQLLAP